VKVCYVNNAYFHLRSFKMKRIKYDLSMLVGNSKKFYVATHAKVLPNLYLLYDVMP